MRIDSRARTKAAPEAQILNPSREREREDNPQEQATRLLTKLHWQVAKLVFLVPLLLSTSANDTPRICTRMQCSVLTSVLST